MFDGLGGIAKATERLSMFTLIFDLMRLDSIPRRELATHTISGAYMLCWKAFETTYCTRGAFIEAFCSKCVPHYWVKVLINEYTKMKQNYLTMTEYITKFDYLSRYASLLVATPEQGMLVSSTVLIIMLRRNYFVSSLLI